jgi:hypothetical protein
MPSSQYEWNIDNATVASINNRGILYAKTLGVATVRVHNRDMPESEAKSLVHVVMPSYLSLKITPKDAEGSSHNPVLITGVDYTAEIEVKDVDNHIIYKTDTLSFDVKIPKDLLNVISSSANKGSHHIKPIKEGVTYIYAKLEPSSYFSLNRE